MTRQQHIMIVMTYTLRIYDIITQPPRKIKLECDAKGVEISSHSRMSSRETGDIVRQYNPSMQTLKDPERHAHT